MKLTVGQCVLLYRHKAGKTHKQLGEAVFPKLSAPHVKIKKIENGKYIPKDKELISIAKELGCQVSDLRDISTEGNADERTCLSEEALSLLPEMEQIFPIINHASNLPRGEFVYDTLITLLKHLISLLESRKEAMTAKEQDGDDRVFRQSS